MRQGIIVTEAPYVRSRWPHHYDTVAVMYFRDTSRDGVYRVIRRGVPRGQTKYGVVNETMDVASKVAPTYRLEFVAIARINRRHA